MSLLRLDIIEGPEIAQTIQVYRNTWDGTEAGVTWAIHGTTHTAAELLVEEPIAGGFIATTLDITVPDDEFNFLVVLEASFESGGSVPTTVDQITIQAVPHLVLPDTTVLIADGTGDGNSASREHIDATYADCIAGMGSSVVDKYNEEFQVFGQKDIGTYQVQQLYAQFEAAVVEPPPHEHGPVPTPAPEPLPHNITLDDVRGNAVLQRKLQENFEAIERQLLALEV